MIYERADNYFSPNELAVMGNKKHSDVDKYLIGSVILNVILICALIGLLITCCCCCSRCGRSRDEQNGRRRAEEEESDEDELMSAVDNMDNRNSHHIDIERGVPH